MDRRGSSVSQQRSPRPSISIDHTKKSPRIAVSFEDHDGHSQDVSPRGSFSADERVYRIPRSPRTSFCSEEPIYIPQGRHYEEKQMYLTTKPCYFYPPHDDRRGSRRSSAFSEHNINLLSPKRRTFCADDRQKMRRQSMSTMNDMNHLDTQPPEVVYSSPTPPVPSRISSPDIDHSDDMNSLDHDTNNMKGIDNQSGSEDDLRPREMITYSDLRRHSLASSASRISNKASSPRSDKSEGKYKTKLKRQQVAASSEHNRSRRSSVATVTESIDNRSVENKSRRESVITLAELQENRSRRSSVNTLGENLDNRSRRSSVITLGDAFENMMRGSRNTLTESPSNRSQRSSPHSRSPSQQSSPHNLIELELLRQRVHVVSPVASETPRRSSVAAMGDSVDSSGTIKEKRRASCSDFSETTHDSRERVAMLHQQHSFPFGKQDEKYRRPSVGAIEVVDQFLSRRSSLQVNQNDGLEDVRSKSGSRSRSRTPSPNIARRDSIPIQRTSPRASPKHIPNEESDDDTFRPISEIPDCTTRVIEWKKGLDKDKSMNDLNEKKSKRNPRSPIHHANMQEPRHEHDLANRYNHKITKMDQDMYKPMQEFRSDTQSPTKHALCTNETRQHNKLQRRPSTQRELHSLSKEEQLLLNSDEYHNRLTSSPEHMHCDQKQAIYRHQEHRKSHHTYPESREHAQQVHRNHRQPDYREFENVQQEHSQPDCKQSKQTEEDYRYIGGRSTIERIPDAKQSEHRHTHLEQKGYSVNRPSTQQHFENTLSDQREPNHSHYNNRGSRLLL